MFSQLPWEPSGPFKSFVRIYICIKVEFNKSELIQTVPLLWYHNFRAYYLLSKLLRLYNLCGVLFMYVKCLLKVGYASSQYVFCHHFLISSNTSCSSESPELLANNSTFSIVGLSNTFTCNPETLVFHFWLAKKGLFCIIF